MRRFALAVLLVAAVAAGCARTGASFDEAGFAERWDAALGGGVDYQLSEAYEPDPGVSVVVRDRSMAPAGRGVDLCYVNAFQTQPHERALWEEHPDLLLREGGVVVEDPSWPGELILDTSTPEHREAIAEIVAGWIDECASAGFDAVEFDNLDAHTRTETLTIDDSAALAELLVRRAHEAGLAAAQKNLVELGERGRAIGFDLVVSEECAVWGECSDYREVWGKRHIDIEYTDQLDDAAWGEACASGEMPALSVLRDRYLEPPGGAEHVVRRC